jgi:amidase
MLPNTAPFDVSGHPAMSLPYGLADGLPVGADAGRQALR